MEKEEFPCYKCLKRPACKNKKRIECSDLFFIVLNTADFDRSNRIVNRKLLKSLKTILFNVENILPEADWKDEIK